MDIKEHFRRIVEEEDRNNNFLHLTVNEPVMSKTARTFMGSQLSDRYFMGGGDEEGVVDYGPGTFLGFPSIQALIDDATKKLCNRLNASSANLNCLSGIHAMMCAILSTTEPGDTVMHVDLKHGGHFCTKGILERTGRHPIPSHYDYKNLTFDAKKIGESFHKHNAKAFYMDVSVYLNPHNLKEIREAIGKDAIIIYDASHTLGLIMGGKFQMPFKEGADVISANTHKTLPGPQKGLVAFANKKIGDKAGAIINGGLYSSPHLTSLIALSTTILEMDKYGAGYAEQVIKNSNSLGFELESLGYQVRKTKLGRFSENHQVHLFTGDLEHYRDFYRKLVKNNIAVNFDNSLGGKMFVRLGTQGITRLGMREAEMRKIANFIDSAMKGMNVSNQVMDFVNSHKNIHYSFDAII